MLLGSNSMMMGSSTTPSGTAPYKIKVAELSGSTVVLSSDGVQLSSIDVDNTPDNIAEFELYDPGSYNITVSNSGSTIWTNSVTIAEIGVYWVKGRVLNNCTAAQIHDACQLGLASKMFSLRDVWTFVDDNSIFNNFKFYITHIFQNQNGTESIQFWMANDAYSTTYQINPVMIYSSDGTSWVTTNNISSQGGYKYSVLRHKFLPQGSTVYSQAQSLKSDTAILADGIAWNALYYSDTKQLAGVYTYGQSTDSFTAISAWQAPTQAAPLFVKGYWKSVGELTEDQFNEGKFYVRTNNVYTLADTYLSGTNYYGFYETLQEDGVFYSAFKSLIDAGYLESMELKQSAGINQRTHYTTINDKVSIPSSSELTGLISSYLEPDGITTKTNAYYGEIANGYNSKWDGVKYIDLFTNANVWLRSVNSNGTYTFVYLYTYGYLLNTPVSTSFRVRPGFRIN